MIEFDSKGYIINAVFDGLEHDNIAKTLVDRFGRPNWIWPDYPEGEPVYSPMEYTPEQLEEKREAWVRGEIQRLYPVDKQLKLMVEKDLRPEAYNVMLADRERIKKESRLKDFQISQNKIE